MFPKKAAKADNQLDVEVPAEAKKEVAPKKKDEAESSSGKSQAELKNEARSKGSANLPN